MASSEKRCLYEVLGLSRDCAPEEIRSAYRKLALQRHPDKLVKSGVPESEATAAFQELVNAYEVLSDARERAWYDSHRNQILFSSSTTSSSGSSSGSFVPDLFSFFSNSVYSGYSDSGRGFYKVYGDLFEKIYTNELNFAKKLGLPLPKEAPLMGNLDSPYVQVTAFYNYWLGFGTSMDFFWADQYDAMAGPNRKSRRLMEEENKKLRKKARREYNETVRGLAEFVKKRDKRVIDMQMKRNEEMERKREEEKQRKKELERQKAERANNYEEPEWAKVEEMEDNEAEDLVEEEKKNELYCVVCSKKFKSDKQWKNHEQSKKHKEKVAELREAFGEQDRKFDETKGNRRKGEDQQEVDGDGTGYLSLDDGVSEIHEHFEGGVSINGEESEYENAVSSEEDVVANIANGSGETGVSTHLGSDDDEASVLEAMVSGRKTNNKLGNQTNAPADKIPVEIDSDEFDFMEYNDTKGSRRNKGGRRRRGRRQNEEPEIVKTDVAAEDSKVEEHEWQNDDSHVKESTSSSLPEPEIETKNRADDEAEKSDKNPRIAVKKNHKTKKETVSKTKVAPKGRRQKAAAEDSNNVCEKCGKEFESRNKLHKHLGDTGHAALKSR
ncbi:hypothetical protein ACJIZ3_020785 [Penstemon smallii]|uniref:Uncharacterized protein n=1 Tax=Penstemon smallii TaxID=265156 RepID=A0ABD3SK09_9LAMI